MMKTGGISQKLVLFFLLSLVGILHTSARSSTGSSVKSRTNSNSSDHKGPPVLVDEANKNKVFRHVRENAELECPLTGNPLPIFDWFKNDRIINEVWERFHQDQGRLIIRSVTHEDSGIYVCRAVNGFGFKNFSVQLEVTGDDTLKNNLLKSSTSKRSSYNESAPQIIYKNLPYKKIVDEVEGNDLFLRCEAKGNPKPNVTWFKDSNNVTGVKDSVATLKLSNLTEKDNGRYRCESTNKLGKDVYEVTLKVTEAWQGAAEILELNPSNLTLFPGQSGSITCLARLEGATLPIMVWVKKVDNATESNKTDKLLQHDGIFYEPLNRNRTDMKMKSKNIYSSVLRITNASSSDTGTYCCAVIGLMGIVDNHIRAHVVIINDSHRPKSATVQRAVLGAFGFLILVVLLVVCVSRLYGCRGPLKNSSKPTMEVAKKTPKPMMGKIQVPKRSPGETLSTTLTQNQNDVLQPLVDGHHSRTISTSISAPRRHGGCSGGGGGSSSGAGGGRQNKLYFCGGEQLHYSLNSTHSNNASTHSGGVDSDFSSSSKNANYVRDQDSSAMYFVNEVDDSVPFNSWSTMLANSNVYRNRDRDPERSRGRDRERSGDRDRDKYRKRWSRKYLSHSSDHIPSVSAIHLPVPAPSCKSSSSEESGGSSVLNYYYEPRRHQHHHYYHHTHKCPKNISPTHLSKCAVLNK